MSQPDFPEMQGPVCPVPLRNHQTIVMGHGSGGLMTHELIKNVFQPYFANPYLMSQNDFAKIPFTNQHHLVVSTDAHIVSPLFFPGGDIGRLAVSGTINDISVSGGIPVGITASFILEEGLPIEVLQKIVKSMAETAAEAGVPVVAGDTKVVEHGKADGVFISTTGLASVDKNIQIGGEKAVPGDVVLISGTLGDHGIAVLSARGELGLSSSIKSDVAPLNSLIQDLLRSIDTIHVMRDPTRGGLATTLNEIATQSSVGIIIQEENIPINPEVAAACELLGFDPLYVANEGKIIVILPEENYETALQIMKKHRYGKAACLIGKVQQQSPGNVLLKTRIGGTRILSMMSGEMLPRIC